ncbi:hypothetical protein BRC94_10635 [Halobacteriales archaeon QS_5_70_17]|nr:MAG: hypothetical protein BRC94_10635 [Halobacteriales archaeon QS_5_70_17]
MATDDDATEDGPTSTESATTVDLPVEGGTAELSIPPSATRGEAAALASAIGAHLNDQRAAAESGPEPADRWSLAGRYGCRHRSDLPRRVERGDEWKMAGRTRR